MTAVVIVLSILCIVLIGMYLSQKMNVKRITKELEIICCERDYHRILLPSPDRDLEQLIIILNSYISECQEQQIQAQKRDEDFKHQIANISHDLRTPLTSILGYVQLINKEYEAGDTAHVREYMDIVERKALLLRGLIGEFYDLSRLEGHEYPLNPEPIDMEILISQVMADYYDELEKKQFEVEVDFSAGCPRVLADRQAMNRVFNNLIQNVLKHGSGRLKVGLRYDARTVTITVANSCPPLDEQELASLFNRFFTVDRMRTGQNTGLGLAIVKNFLDQMGFTIQASYEKGFLVMTICKAIALDYDG